MGFYEKRVFPYLNDFITERFNEERRELLESAHGHLLEIGFGSGRSLPYYPKNVKKVTGIEPNEGMIQKFKKSGVHQAQLDAEVLKACSENLPFENDLFDGVSVFLTFCTVKDLAKSISEIKRVLKPEGKLFLLEHIAQPRGTATRMFQNSIQPLWKKIACGCNMNRETIIELEKFGFKMDEMKIIGHNGFPNFFSPIIAATGSFV